MIDSSVLVAAFYRGHPHFAASHALLLQLPEKQRTAALHSLSEVYAAITRLPVSPKPSPSDALLYMQSLATRIRWIAASEKTYQHALTRTASLGLAGAKIYDSLILATAIEHGATQLYTWNLKDFTLLAQGLPISILPPPN